MTSTEKTGSTPNSLKNQIRTSNKDPIQEEQAFQVVRTVVIFPTFLNLCLADRQIPEGADR